MEMYLVFGTETNLFCFRFFFCQKIKRISNLENIFLKIYLKESATFVNLQIMVEYKVCFMAERP